MLFAGRMEGFADAGQRVGADKAGIGGKGHNFIQALTKPLDGFEATLGGDGFERIYCLDSGYFMDGVIPKGGKYMQLQ